MSVTAAAAAAAILIPPRRQRGTTVSKSRGHQTTGSSQLTSELEERAAAAFAIPLASILPSESFAHVVLPDLPQQEVHLVVLRHDTPAVASAGKSVCDNIVNPLLARISTLHPSVSIQIGEAVYGDSSPSSASSSPLLSSRRALSKTSFAPASEWTGRGGKHWAMKSTADPSSANMFSALDSPSKDAASSRSSGNIVEGLVGCVELFESFAVSTAVSTLRQTTVVARYVLHVSSSSIDLAGECRPLLNTSSQHDDWSWRNAASHLGQVLRVGLCTVTLESDDSSVSSPSNDAQEVHRAFFEGTAPRIPDDPVHVLGAAWKAPQGSTMLLTGFSEVEAARLARGSKRDRDEDNAAVSIKRVKTDAGIDAADSDGTSVGVVPTASASSSMPQGPSPEVRKQFHFLQTQQLTMSKNLTAAMQSLASAQKSSSTQGTLQLMETLKGKLASHQAALRTQAQAVMRGMQPNLAANLQMLQQVDTEAARVGIFLGGPNAQQAPTAVQGGIVPINTTQSSVPQRQPSVSQPHRPSLPTAAASSLPAAGSSSTPTAFWWGALSWTIHVPDPTNPSKAPAPRELIIYLNAIAPQNSLVDDNHLLPWPSKLVISNLVPVSTSELRSHAMARRAPFIALVHHPVAPQGQAPIPAAAATQSEKIFRSFLSSLLAKNSCAFIRHGTGNGGIVLVAVQNTSQGAQPASQSPRLLGIVYKDEPPFANLLSSASTIPRSVAQPLVVAAAGQLTPAQQQARVQQTLLAKASASQSFGSLGGGPAQSQSQPQTHAQPGQMPGHFQHFAPQTLYPQQTVQPAARQTAATGSAPGSTAPASLSSLPPHIQQQLKLKLAQATAQGTAPTTQQQMREWIIAQARLSQMGPAAQVGQPNQAQAQGLGVGQGQLGMHGIGAQQQQLQHQQQNMPSYPAVGQNFASQQVTTQMGMFNQYASPVQQTAQQQRPQPSAAPAQNAMGSNPANPFANMSPAQLAHLQQLLANIPQ